MTYSKEQQTKKTVTICARSGCKVKVLNDKYCSLHSAKKSKKGAKKPIRKKSKREYPIAMASAKQAFQLWVRLRDADIYSYCDCISCGKRIMYNKLDAGHYFPATKSGTLFDEVNVNAQCKGCNQRMNDPMIQDGYKKGLIKKYGKKDFDKLVQMSYISLKYNTLELNHIRFKYTKQAEDLYLIKFGSQLNHALCRKKDYKEWKQNLQLNS